MVHIAADLPQFLQRRELAAYEQRLARTAYAYGVDLRRAQWLSGSTIGDPLMRAVDRRWSRLVHGLEEDSLRPLRKAPPTPLLEELARLMHMLRAPLPTLRILRPEVAAQWPAVTPLGTTKGGMHWLVLDLDRVMSLPADERTFVLAAGLGHLQCEHGPIFAAHLMAHRGTASGEVSKGDASTSKNDASKSGASKNDASKSDASKNDAGKSDASKGSGRPFTTLMVRSLLRPWAKVAVFSADRAGLVAVGSLPVALRAIERQHAEHVEWVPRWPSLETRAKALEDFDRSALMARRRVLSGDDGNGWAIAPPGREEELDSLSRKLAAAFDGAIKLGSRLALRIEGYERRKDDEPEGEGEKKAETGEQGGAEASDDRKAKAERGKTRKGKAQDAKASEAKASNAETADAAASEASEADAAQAPAIDPERASLLEQALRDAWTLARCDERLTRRLGLL